MTEYVSEALRDTHSRSAFDCGAESLNEWLAGQAMRAQVAGVARTRVWTAREDPATVWAYYSIAPTEVLRTEVSGGMASGYSRIPAYLLARLAVHTELRDVGGCGQELLVDALTHIASVAEAGGGRLIVVDAIDENAAGFYKHHNFTAVKDNPLRLVIKMTTVQKYLDW